ncbi:unnamed protein product [Candidula unifasciata]|uniref:Uncharacterized protein n=1 Tax=Candidula unifasciata TaxID=100452 RepID=A0A8S3YD86_9EUPU|nr:unnamed protein product [Candidula unifasciata]
MLRLVSGKGYVFCPGFPEKFVVGKACGKFVVLHKVPFKRYQSTHCLVYYKGQGNQQIRVNSSLCALCPRCLQAAKSIFALPNFSADASTATVHMPLQLENHRQPKSEQKTITCSNNTTDVAIPLRGEKSSANQLAADHMNGLSSQRDCLGSTDSSFSSEPHNRANFSSKHHISELDVNGNTEAAGSLSDLDRRSKDSNRHSNVDAKIQVLTQVLTNLMQVQCQQKSVDVNLRVPELAG